MYWNINLVIKVYGKLREKVIEEKIDVEPVKRIKKKKGKNQDILRVCLDKELYKSFKEKCEKMNISEDMIIKNMIMEWLE